MNRKISIDDKTIKTVHYTHGGEKATIDVDAYEYEGKWVADIPNILLQEKWDILVYGYDIDYTRYEQKFEVINRDKPFGYVYYATEFHTWEQLNDKKVDKDGWTPDMMLGTDAQGNIVTKKGGVGAVDSVNGKKGEVILKAEDIDFNDGQNFQEKLDSGALNGKDGKTPIKGVDYFTPTEIEAIETNSAAKVKVPTKVSELQNDSDFLTEHQSLEDYYNKASIDEFLDGKQVKGDYALKDDLIPINEELNKKQPIGDYALKSELPLTTVVTLTTDKVTLNDNTIYRGDKLASINFELPTMQPTNLFDCELDLTVNTNPMQVTAPADIKWLGDDIQNNAWVPQLNKRYVLFIHYDGQYFRAVSQSEEAI